MRQFTEFEKNYLREFVEKQENPDPELSQMESSHSLVKSHKITDNYVIYWDFSYSLIEFNIFKLKLMKNPFYFQKTVNRRG